MRSGFSPSDIQEFKHNLKLVRDHPSGEGLPTHLAIKLASRMTWPKGEGGSMTAPTLLKTKSKFSAPPPIFGGRILREHKNTPPPFYSGGRKKSMTHKGTNRSEGRGYVLDVNGKHSPLRQGGKSQTHKGTSGLKIPTPSKRKGGASMITTDQQLESILGSVPGFQGCFAIDEINNVKLSPIKDVSFIVNSDPSTKPGQHWVAVYISPVKDKTCDVFDSLAEMSPLSGEELQEMLITLSDKIEALDIDYPLKLHENKVRDQRANSSTCGWFAAQFILKRASGQSFKKASTFKGIEPAEHSLYHLEGR